jgi:hypothetical protein
LAAAVRLYLESPLVATKALIQSLTHSLLLVAVEEYQMGPIGFHKTMAALAVANLMTSLIIELLAKETPQALLHHKAIMEVKEK